MRRRLLRRVAAFCCCTGSCSSHLAIALICATFGLQGCSTAPEQSEGYGGSNPTAQVVLAHGEGPTVEHAKEAALKSAIDQTVGVLVLSDQTVSDGKALRNETSTHRSAYVSEIDIVESVKLGAGKHRVTLWAKVTRSNLAYRSIKPAENGRAVDTAAAVDQLKALLAYKEDGDRVLRSTLSNYPSNAFSVTLENTSLEVDANRQSHLKLLLRIEWRPLYVEALREAAELLSVDRSHCNRLTAELMLRGVDWNSPGPRDRQGNPLPVTGLCGEYGNLLLIRREKGKTLDQVYGYSFDDVPRLSLLEKTFGQPLWLRLELESAEGRAAESFCQAVDEHPLFVMGSTGYRRHPQTGALLPRLEIHASEPWRVEWPLQVLNLDKFRRVKRLSARLVNQCPKA